MYIILLQIYCDCQVASYYENPHQLSVRPSVYVCLSVTPHFCANSYLRKRCPYAKSQSLISHLALCRRQHQADFCQTHFLATAPKDFAPNIIFN